MKLAYAGRFLVAAILLFLACDSDTVPDAESPQVRFILPHDGDTLDTGPNLMRAVATDNQEVYLMSFWIRGEFIGIARNPRADTYEIWWECSREGFTSYTLSAVAEDRAGNDGLDEVVVYIRR